MAYSQWANPALLSQHASSLQSFPCWSSICTISDRREEAQSPFANRHLWWSVCHAQKHRQARVRALLTCSWRRMKSVALFRQPRCNFNFPAIFRVTLQDLMVRKLLWFQTFTNWSFINVLTFVVIHAIFEVSECVSVFYFCLKESEEVMHKFAWSHATQVGQPLRGHWRRRWR